MSMATIPSDHATDSPMAPPLDEQVLASANQDTDTPSPYPAWITIVRLALCAVLSFLYTCHRREATFFTKRIQVLLSIVAVTRTQGWDCFTKGLLIDSLELKAQYPNTQTRTQRVSSRIGTSIRPVLDRYHLHLLTALNVRLD